MVFEISATFQMMKASEQRTLIQPFTPRKSVNVTKLQLPSYPSTNLILRGAYFQTIQWLHNDVTTILIALELSIRFILVYSLKWKNFSRVLNMFPKWQQMFCSCELKGSIHISWLNNLLSFSSLQRYQGLNSFTNSYRCLSSRRKENKKCRCDVEEEIQGCVFLCLSSRWVGRGQRNGGPFLPNFTRNHSTPRKSLESNINYVCQEVYECQLVWTGSKRRFAKSSLTSPNLKERKKELKVISLKLVALL